MSSQVFGEIDLNSPGYEYLRSHRSMNNLHAKLVALDYQKDFCSMYRCPPIHKYYFSFRHDKPSEQQFIFTCLCAWLIKYKCQMNLDLSPEEYQDVDTTIGTIIEALKLLLILDGELDHKSQVSMMNFTPARLKEGFGPEVIWTISVLADRALELHVEATPNLGRMQILFHDKQQALEASSRGQLNSIIIGQPIVGGGLTTRPLGNYKIDDSSLLLTNEQSDEKLAIGTDEPSTDELTQEQIELWHQQVERDTAALRAASEMTMPVGSTMSTNIELAEQLDLIQKVRKGVQEFSNQSKSLLETIANKIDRQLQIISGRESFLQQSLKKQLGEFLYDWRDYNQQANRNKQLLEQVSAKTDLFEAHSARIKTISLQMDERARELNDGTKLKEMKQAVDALALESKELDLRVNLLLMVYAKKQSKAFTREVQFSLK